MNKLGRQNNKDFPIEIPPQLQKKQLRFVKIKKESKQPFESNWQESNNYRYDHPELKAHLKQGGNFGVLCGSRSNNLVVVDADNDEVAKAVEKELPKTFTVRSGGGGKHYYFFCNDLENSIRMKEDEAGDLGDVQFEGKQVIGPNCIHPNGNQYEVISSEEIKEITAEELRIALKNFTRNTAEETKKSLRSMKPKTKEFDIPIVDVASTGQLNRQGEEFYGEHPVHGSTTGRNFWINPSKNTWHCFRHDTGGGPLQWLAVREGIIDCSESIPGGLDGEKFKQTLEKAREEELIEEIKPKPSKQQINNWDDIRELYEKAQDPNSSIRKRDAWFKTAQKLVEEDHYITYEDTEEVLKYNADKGIYEENAEFYIKSKVTEKIGAEATNHTKKEIIGQVKALTGCKREEIGCPEKHLPVKNGLLDLENLELKEYKPEQKIDWQIPTEYDPDADCSMFKIFLNEILDNKPPVYAINTIQEYFGYVLWHWDFPHHKDLLLVGEGSNGKSQLLRILVKVIGEDNITSHSLYDLVNERFYQADLYHSLANIDSDLESGTLKNTGMFKKISGGDKIKAEEKYKDPFFFKNKAKFIYSAQKVPSTDDKSHAFWRRWLLVPFNKTIPEGKQIPRIGEKIAKNEASGILNWLIKGYKRLKKQLDFSYNLNEADLYDKWQEWGSAIDQFFNTYLQENSNNWIPTDELYKKYRKFAREKGESPTARTWFVRKLKNNFDNLQKSKRKHKEERKSGYKGIEWKNTEELKNIGIRKDILDLAKKQKQWNKQALIMALCNDYDQEIIETTLEKMLDQGTCQQNNKDGEKQIEFLV